MPDEPGDFPRGTPPTGDPSPPPPPDLVGGVLVTIDTAGERWSWWVTRPETAQALHDVWVGTHTLGWFGGGIRSGPGLADHNAPWSWHVDPQQNIADAIGLYQPESARTPSDCENRLAYWLNGSGMFVPMDATIVEFHDRRLSSETPGPR